MVVGNGWREIELSGWKRARHYALFAGSDFPFIGVSSELDITEWDAARRRSGRKFFSAFLQTVMLAMNSIENFRYRIDGGKVFLCERIDPSFVVFEPEEELYYFASTDTTEDAEAFDLRVEDAKRAALATRYLANGRIDVAYVSCFPWFGFTDVIQPLQLRTPDSIVRVLWGRYRRSGDSAFIPFSITGHHGLFDGAHIGRLLAAIQGRKWYPQPS